MARSCDAPERRLRGRPGDAVVPEVVAELLELVEDHGFRPSAANGPARIEDLFHIALATGCSNDLSTDVLEPRETLTAHFFRQDRYRPTTKQCAVESATATVVARGRPDSLMPRWIKRAADQSRHKAAERGPNLVGASGKVLADESDYPRLDAGQLGG